MEITAQGIPYVPEWLPITQGVTGITSLQADSSRDVALRVRTSS